MEARMLARALEEAATEADSIGLSMSFFLGVHERMSAMCLGDKLRFLAARITNESAPIIPADAIASGKVVPFRRPREARHG